MSQNNEQVMRMALEAIENMSVKSADGLERLDIERMASAATAIRAALAAQAEKLEQLHQYEEIAEHYAKCAISPEALRDWVVAAQAGQSVPVAAQKALASWGCTGKDQELATIMQRGDDLANVLRQQTHPAPVRQPLTDDELRNITQSLGEYHRNCVCHYWIASLKFARTIEAAHGITAQGGA